MDNPPKVKHWMLSHRAFLSLRKLSLAFAFIEYLYFRLARLTIIL